MSESLGATPDVNNFETPADHILSGEDQETLEQFNPVPYRFVVKDVRGKSVNIPSHRLPYARVECPGFHVLLDHLLAVLWIFYSKKDLDLLESAQIHWALKVLEGTKNKQCEYTEDVQMAMDHLRDAYIDVCANTDLSKLESRLNGRDNHKKDPAAACQSGAADQDALKNTSLHLADMVSGSDKSVFKELLSDINQCPSGDEICVPARVPSDLAKEKTSMLEMRNNKFQEVVGLIEEIKRLDNSLLRNPVENNDPNSEPSASNLAAFEAPSEADNLNQGGKENRDVETAKKREIPAYDPRMQL